MARNDGANGWILRNAIQYEPQPGHSRFFPPGSGEGSRDGAKRRCQNTPFTMRRNCFLLVSCLLLATLSCSGEDSDRTAKRQRQLHTLHSKNDSLERRSKRLRDSLRRRSLKLHELEEDLTAQKKLRSLLLDNRIGLWAPDEQAMHIRFADSVDTQDVGELVDAFNGRFAGSFNPELRLRSVDGSVARVGVSDDSQLGERMGSTGSEMYMASMTYTLTSLGRIDSVYLDIEGGSHARPGYYSRKTWVDLVQED